MKASNKALHLTAFPLILSKLRKPKGSLILLLNSAQVLLLKAVIILGAVWPKTYFLFLFPSSFSETRIRSFDKEIKYCISVSISLSLSLSKLGILLRLPWNLGSDGFLINPSDKKFHGKRSKMPVFDKLSDR